MELNYNLFNYNYNCLLPKFKPWCPIVYIEEVNASNKTVLLFIYMTLI